MRPGPFILILALAMSPVVAMADEPSFGPAYGPANDPSGSAVRTDTKWYGLPILLSDLASAAMWSLAAGTATSTYGGGPAVPLTVVAIFPYVITSPVVHALHGHGWRAVGSVALRLSLPAVGMVIGFFAGAECSPPSGVVPSGIESCDSLGGAFKGALVGSAIAAVVAMVIDDAALPWEPPADTAPAKASLRPPGLQWLPTLGVAHDSGNNAVPTFGVAGSF
jgi:hypothetical protein